MTRIGHDHAMRHVLLCGAVFALAAVASSSARGAGSIHTLALADRAPVVVVGTGFAPNASVHVTVTAAGRHLTRVAHASHTGRLRVRWLLQSLPACSLVVVASATNDHLVTRSLPASGATCGGPPGPLGPPTLGP
jgi:hypothetical protein